ncbi:MAG: tetratricopeptide repeat protein [Pirellulaceae bacterium]
MPDLNSDPSPWPSDQPTSPSADRPAAPRPEEEKPARSRISHWLRFLILVLIGVSAIALLQTTPTSRAQWYWAASLTALEAGDLETAISQAEAAIQIAPEDAPQRSRYAELLFRLDREEDALTQVLKSIESAPDNLQLVSRNAFLLGRMKQHDQALKWLDHVVEQSLAGGNIHRHQARNQRAYGIALAYADGDASPEDLKRGLEDIHLAMEEYGDEPAYRDTRGYLYLLSDQLEQAEDDLTRAISPYEQRHTQLLAELAEQKGSAQVAAQANKTFLESVLAVMYHHRAELYRRQGKEELAQQDQQRANKFGLSRKLGNW